MIAGNLIKATEAGGPPPPPALSVFITPSEIRANSPNGAWQSPLITANASGGTQPYSYAWSINNGNMQLSSTSDQSIRVTASGYNDLVTGTLTCTVTDGAAGNESDDIFISVFFGNQL